jgi:hypothetical protein
MRTRSPVGPGQKAAQIRNQCQGSGCDALSSRLPAGSATPGNLATARESSALIPITIEPADGLHRLSTTLLWTTGRDRRHPPCIRKVQTVALAVVPGKRDESSLLAEPGRCKGASRPDVVRKRNHPGSTWRTGPSSDRAYEPAGCAQGATALASAAKHRDHRLGIQRNQTGERPSMAPQRDHQSLPKSSRWQRDETRSKKRSNTNEDDQLTSR